MQGGVDRSDDVPVDETVDGADIVWCSEEVRSFDAPGTGLVDSRVRERQQGYAAAVLDTWSFYKPLDDALRLTRAGASFYETTARLPDKRELQFSEVD
jgi:hypothetical protein